jgi:hypothetical protein
LASSRAAAHIPTFLSKRTSSVRSLDLNTAMVSSHVNRVLLESSLD